VKEKKKYKLKGREKDKPRVDIEQWDAVTRAEYERIYAAAKKINIITMREEARRMGLKSATTYEKERLTEVIALAQLNNTVLKTEIAGIPQPICEDEKAGVIDDYAGRTRVLDPVDIEGIVCIDDRSEAWVRPDFVRDDYKDAYLSMRIVNDYKLKDGDLVKGKVRGLQKAQRYALYKVETINGVAAADFVRPECPKKVVVAHGEDRLLKLNFDDSELTAVFNSSPISKGEVKLYVGAQCRYMGGLARGISKSFSAEGYWAVTLLLDEKISDVSIKSELDGWAAALDIEQSLNADEAALAAFRHASVAVAAGVDTALIINNADSVSYRTLTSILNGAGQYTSGSLTIVLTVSVLGSDPSVSRLARVVDSVYFAD